ncbi:Zinc-finger (CX5CX6HX5H) motif [Carpediemonas membranifera]|uniref:Zinc-finger (CX5CX6HX5H) motif n=1 Tax=Carpediemonas membranifera TaxID=201153 RepID=A0A8J6ATP1_9EUKA|nr:Zinc-finger (CX5CX6HX5H) motif [Carpediemonas membranifera]|eukprot:KAG9394321.1 Zinc-finger (CX5CX6HX5H) motif [Carpediemonas membranifera]
MVRLILKPLTDDCEEFVIEQGKTETIGRQKAGIASKRVSRNHMEIQFTSEGQIFINRLGANPSELDGEILPRNEETEAGFGQTLAILRGEMQFKLTVDPPPEEDEDTEVEEDAAAVSVAAVSKKAKQTSKRAKVNDNDDWKPGQHGRDADLSDFVVSDDEVEEVSDYSPRSPRTQTVDGKPVCKYGKGCYRKNPVHFQEFAHPWLDDEQDKMTVLSHKDLKGARGQAKSQSQRVPLSESQTDGFTSPASPTIKPAAGPKLSLKPRSQPRPKTPPPQPVPQRTEHTVLALKENAKKPVEVRTSTGPRETRGTVAVEAGATVIVVPAGPRLDETVSFSTELAAIGLKPIVVTKSTPPEVDGVSFRPGPIRSIRGSTLVLPLSGMGMLGFDPVSLELAAMLPQLPGAAGEEVSVVSAVGSHIHTECGVSALFGAVDGARKGYGAVLEAIKKALA